MVVILSVGTDTILEQTGVLPHGALFDTGLLLLALMYRSLYSLIGSYFAAKLAPHHPMRHALALGVLGIVMSGQESSPREISDLPGMSWLWSQFRFRSRGWAARSSNFERIASLTSGGLHIRRENPTTSIYQSQVKSILCI